MPRHKRRELRLRSQAAELMEFALPGDYRDPHRPDLAAVKEAMLIIGHFMLKSARRGDPVPLLDEQRLVRVWLTSDDREVVEFMVEASYDGGRTFTNPLIQYQAKAP